LGVSSLVFAERILIALVLGVAIGIERQWRQRMAGLRTNALVAVGAALFASISILMNAQANPTQVAAYVVSGIGFLAGAVIFKEGLSVRGLNTAATLWATAAVGTLSGSGFVGEAAIGAVAVIGANVLLRPIVQRINRQPLDQSELLQAYEVAVVCPGSAEERVRGEMLSQLRSTTLVLQSLESHDVEETRVLVTATVVTSSRADAKLERIVGRLSREATVVAASWRVSQPARDRAAESEE
jgi:putative Mg2+ transporter-C (MgtC) family protein